MKIPNELQVWFMAHQAEDDLLWKKSSESQIMFVRDRVKRIFSERYEVPNPHARSGTSMEWFRALCLVRGTHTSKSVLLPVYEFDLPYVRLTMRDNFYNWKLSVESRVGPVQDTFGNLILEGRNEDVPSIYCEGMEGIGRTFPSLTTSPERFTIEIYNDYSLWTCCWLLHQQLRPKADEAKLREEMLRQDAAFQASENVRCREYLELEQQKFAAKEQSSA